MTRCGVLVGHLGHVLLGLLLLLQRDLLQGGVEAAQCRAHPRGLHGTGHVSAALLEAAADVELVPAHHRVLRAAAVPRPGLGKVDLITDPK